jgi:hypothetical protein
MPLPRELTDKIQHRLHTFLTDAAPDPLRLREVVGKFGALPLTLDMGGCVALRCDGEVVSFAWDEPHEFKVENDLRVRNAALFQGSLKYPELRALVPLRPDNAAICRHCSGTGKVDFGREQSIDSVVCFAVGSAGFLPDVHRVLGHGWPRCRCHQKAQLT